MLVNLKEGWWGGNKTISAFLPNGQKRAKSFGIIRGFFDKNSLFKEDVQKRTNQNGKR